MPVLPCQEAFLQKQTRIFGVILRILFAVSIILLLPVFAFAWPTSAEWMPVLRSNTLLQDDNGDAQGSRNIVSGPGYAASYISNDTHYVYFRMRLDRDPSGAGGQGLLEPYGWGLDIDANINAGNYEWLVIVDGISQVESIGVWQNTIQGNLGDPSDKPEILVYSASASGNIQINPADTSFNGSLDYFLDWRIPTAAFYSATGLTENSPLRFFFGSSSSANVLSPSGADLVGVSDLYSGFTDYITPLGTKPTTGTVRFAAALTGSGDVIEAASGSNLYLRVDDADRNYNTTSLQTVMVVLNTPGGDSETLILTETGVNTGIFTTGIATVSALAVPGDGTLQVIDGETVTVTYIDTINEQLQLNTPRTDALLISPPVIAVTKTVDVAEAVSGSTVTYTVDIINSGAGLGWLTSIQEVLPSGFTYLAGTTSGITTADPAINAGVLTWTGAWTVPRKSGTVNGKLTLSFKARAGFTGGTFYNNVRAAGTNFSPVSSGDTAPVVVTTPLVVLSKQADKTAAAPGQVITYVLYYRNAGNGAAQNLMLVDTVPAFTAYMPGSLRLGDAASTYTTALPRTDAAGDDEAQTDGSGGIVFIISSLTKDDGVSGSGGDEGRAYFKVVVR